MLLVKNYCGIKMASENAAQSPCSQRDKTEEVKQRVPLRPQLDRGRSRSGTQTSAAFWISNCIRIAAAMKVISKSVLITCLAVQRPSCCLYVLVLWLSWMVPATRGKSHDLAETLRGEVWKWRAGPADLQDAGLGVGAPSPNRFCSGV